MYPTFRCAMIEFIRRTNESARSSVFIAALGEGLGGGGEGGGVEITGSLDVEIREQRY